jgi:hypothetical protein
VKEEGANIAIKRRKCNIRNKRFGLMTETQRRRRLKVTGGINKKQWKDEDV